MKRLSLIIRKLGIFVGFAVFYLQELMFSSLRVAYDVLTPGHQMRPAFLHLPVGDLSECQRFVLTNLLSMTPGTLSVDLLDEDQTLLIHSMYSVNPETEIQKLERTFKRKIQNVF